MDHRLEKALEFGNYLATFYRQRELLQEKFTEDTVFYYNGGKFTVTQELITYCFLAPKLPQSIILLDDNKLPIKIEDVQKFYETIASLYQTACEEYYNAYEEMKKIRSVESLISDE